MRKVVIAGFIGVGLLSGSASAQSLKGWCYPVDGCMGEQIPIGSGTYGKCDSSCTLTNPVPIRDMEATLYDEVCGGDWGSMTNRIMFVKHSHDQIRMFAINEYQVTELEICN